MTARVLVVEDDPVIAFEVEAALSQAGFEITGLANSVERALASIDASPCDVALLDANLRGESVEPVALALRERGTPFLFISGYERMHLPAAFIDVTLVSKPFTRAGLIRAVRVILSQ
jgi:DNA-binding response OmpR family regulator